MKQLERLDKIALEAWNGNYERIGVLSSGERRYVALASGRMREICPGDSIALAVELLEPEWLAHMIENWRGMPQPQN